jgi:hypothetical protein
VCFLTFSASSRRSLNLSSASTTRENMTLRRLLVIPFILVIFSACNCDENETPAPSLGDSVRHHEIVFQNKEETLFEVKSTTERKPSTEPSTTTRRPSSTTTVVATTRAPNRFNKRPTIRTTSQRPTVTTPSAITAASTLSTSNHSDNDSNTSDRIGN